MASINYNDMKNLMECGVCLDGLVNAKDLNCSHSYCKVYVDEILMFLPDGSAVIECPLIRCEEKTIIKDDQTSNDLVFNVHLKSVIEFLYNSQGKKDEHRINCFNHTKCKMVASVYCSCCFKKLCSKCKIGHAHEANRRNDYKLFRLQFDYDVKEGNSIVPLCIEHSTYATYFCCESFI